MIDYKKIIEELENEQIKELLYRLGAEDVIEKENCYITNTICHNEEGGSYKLYYYFNNHCFVCYSNCDVMSPFKFLETYYQTRGIDYDWYKDVFLVIKNCSNYNPNLERKERYKSISYKYQKEDKIKLESFDEGILEVFTKYYPIEWLKDGISKKAMDKFNIKYSISQNKIIIPHYDTENRLIGIRGRALNEYEIEEYGKYAPVKIEDIMYNHRLSYNLYGLNITKENIKNTGICFLVEGEKGVLQLEDFSFPNCGAAVCGSSLNIHQLRILMEECHPKEIILCFDNEELEGEEKYFLKLYDMCKKYKNYCNMSFIYDRQHLTNLKESPTDRGENVFKQLISKRVKI